MLSELPARVAPDFGVASFFTSGLGETKLEKYETDGKREYFASTSGSGTTTTSAPANVVVPPKWTFIAWMRGEDYDFLYDSWMVRSLAALPTGGIAIRTFLAFTLAIGLLFGGVRILIVVQAGDTTNLKHLLLPFSVPLISLLAVVLLTGFGPIFQEGIDSTTSRLLVIITVVIGINPEQFIHAWRQYMVSLLESGKLAQAVIGIKPGRQSEH